ncbi:Rha family transcriptional regulator [Enterococcus faecalis]|uniref:Rha family transcriptional regulator n=1 Tax=Enterococcus faecalis TaxID=1351 RepID=UPI001CF2AA82|nr:Rha family transcriptional regulator [Enterococcus faecalis]MCA6777740.1 Rha family transcriptional regulator [Enterococcus faecalis]HCT6711172.1 Rha family transcriptional regulator [Enterococcus faecalis]HCT6950297.1 Rha family transcriptional regulator [Enterococcus faecalis]HCT6953169.1 Rha family transcriptional regulator [Enterococcus faecalis]HCT6961319.1 Rha family transcriptional regulator [Enterococcus faecalis]
MNNLVIMKDQQAVTSSLQVAEVFEKQHKHVIEAIEAKIQSAENSAYYQNMFAEGEYKDSRGRKQRLYYMNRDGWAFIAFGFTGKKADAFKLKYIEAFNQMENYIKEQLDTSTLSPELQFMNSVVQSLAKQEIANKRLENKVDNITDIIALNTTDWRKECRRLVNKMAKTQGEFGAYQEIQTAIYDEVDRRAGSSLKIRLTNLKNRMAYEGASKSKIRNTNKLDVIDNDKRLKEIYLAVVKDFAIKYGIWKEN